MLTTIFYLIRHGESEGNVQHILQGQTNSNLTKTGIKQAKNLAKKLKKIKFDSAYSSDLVRAYNTALIISRPHKLKVTKNQLLREMSFGKYEGCDVNQFEQKLLRVFESREKMKKEQRLWHQASKEIELDGKAAERMCGFLQKTAQKNPGTTNLVVSHGAMIRVFLISIGFASYKQLEHGTIDNCAYIKLEFNNKTFQVTETHKIKLL